MTEPPEPRDDWNPARPEHIPESTFAPAAAAFGITFVFWGMVTSPVLWGIGLLVFSVALVAWIGEMRK